MSSFSEEMKPQVWCIQVFDPAQTAEGLAYAIVEDLPIMGFPSMVVGFIETSPSENIRPGEALRYGNETDQDHE